MRTLTLSNQVGYKSAENYLMQRGKSSAELLTDQEGITILLQRNQDVVGFLQAIISSLYEVEYIQISSLCIDEEIDRYRLIEGIVKWAQKKRFRGFFHINKELLNNTPIKGVIGLNEAEANLIWAALPQTWDLYLIWGNQVFFSLAPLPRFFGIKFPWNMSRATVTLPSLGDFRNDF